jgi:hypothetical protein
MTSTISFDLDRLKSHTEQGTDVSDQPFVTYWKAENHQVGTYSRLEEWMKDLEDYVLPVRQTASSIDITLDMGRAMMRYREELKMFAAIYNQDHPDRTIDVLEDVKFLQERHKAIKEEWPLGKETPEWWNSLVELMNKIDEAIARIKEQQEANYQKFTGIFIKLSVRSPKDSAMLMDSYRDHLRHHIQNSSIPPDSPYALGDDVAAIRYANWQSTCCYTSEEALLLLVRSDRVHLDVQHHELFCEGDKTNSFHLELHVSAFFHDFDPAYEFRGFVSNGQRTALTIYNPWVYDDMLIAKEADVLEQILQLWDSLIPKIRSTNYSLDFAVSRDFQHIWIIELNNFLPPLAGSGLFQFHDENDKKVLFEGPFEFRIRKTPVTEVDFAYTRVDRVTGKTIHVTMQPASDEIMLFVKNLRREKFGCPLIDIPAELRKKKQKEILFTSGKGMDEVEDESKRRSSCVIA